MSRQRQRIAGLLNVVAGLTPGRQLLQGITPHREKDEGVHQYLMRMDLLGKEMAVEELADILSEREGG